LGLFDPAGSPYRSDGRLEDFFGAAVEYLSLADAHRAPPRPLHAWLPG